MKILKSILVLILFFNLITSCTADDITEESETNTVENIQAIAKKDRGKVIKKEKGKG